MAYTLSEKNANIFENNFKTKETHPDYKASFLFEGKPFNIALWKKKDRNGKVFFSMNIGEKIVTHGGTPITTPPVIAPDGTAMPF
jgi:hypothetical protein